MSKKKFFGIILAMIIATAAILVMAEEHGRTTQCWVLCKDYANLRIAPDKDSRCVGQLDVGEGFQTDGTSRNGWVRVLDAGETECWIYSGYVVTEKPVKVYENYLCVANKQVACRRWVNGPKIEGRLGWLHNGTTVSVFWIAGDWAITSRGYIKSEWLEVDPE